MISASSSVEAALSSINQNNVVLSGLKGQYDQLNSDQCLLIYGINNTSSKLIDFLLGESTYDPGNLILVDDDPNKASQFHFRKLNTISSSECIPYLINTNMIIIVSQRNGPAMTRRLVDRSIT